MRPQKLKEGDIIALRRLQDIYRQLFVCFYAHCIHVIRLLVRLACCCRIKPPETLQASHCLCSCFPFAPVPAQFRKCCYSPGPLFFPEPQWQQREDGRRRRREEEKHQEGRRRGQNWEGAAIRFSAEQISS